jgi:hypothetical protein
MGISTFKEKDSSSSSVPRRVIQRRSSKGVTFIDGTTTRLPIPPPPPFSFTYYEIINGIEYYDIEDGERYYETI